MLKMLDEAPEDHLEAADDAMPTLGWAGCHQADC